MTPSSEAYVTPEEDLWNENIAQAMKLLLAARGRVLTLSEQRVNYLHFFIEFLAS